MALAKKCDRCKKYFEDSENSKEDDINYMIAVFKDRDNKHFDLCSKCASELKEWLKYPEYASVVICRPTPMGTTNIVTKVANQKNPGGEL